MKPRIGVLTAFRGADSAYSLVNVVRVQLDMLIAGGYDPVFLAAAEFTDPDPHWSGRKFEVRRTAPSDAPPEEIVPILRQHLSDLDILFCHDLVFLHQYSNWAEAVRRLSVELPNHRWLHWQHSRGGHEPIKPVLNSWFCYPNQGDLQHVASINSTDLEHVRYIPHSLDLNYLGWPASAIQLAEQTGFPFADASAVLPTRLDRQKQVEKALRLFIGLKRAGLSISFLIADAFATGEHFLGYKREVDQEAREAGLTIDEFSFLSDLSEEFRLKTPREVVKALYEMSNLFVLPSNAETSSLVAMEAALAGNLLVLNTDFPPILHLYQKAIAFPFGSIFEDTQYFRHITTADGQVQKILDKQLFWDDQARNTLVPVLASILSLQVKKQQFRDRWPSRVLKNHLEPLINEVYHPRVIELTYSTPSDKDVTAIITTMDNLPILKRQIEILSRECEHIIVVNNGSIDSTRGYLEGLMGYNVSFINKENNGAGPGRNAGLKLWNFSTPYVFLIDGGILPIKGSIQPMKEYLESHPDVGVVSPEIASCFVDNEEDADRVFGVLDEATCFSQRMLSSTAYALCRKSVWEASLWCEEGPFAEPGWGVDDNYMQYEWNNLGIIHKDFSGVKLYRRGGGSFQRLYQETGIWPNQYGSVYEKRNLLTIQRFPQYWDPIWQKNFISVSCVVLGWNEYPMIARAVKALHDELANIPHEVIVVDNGSTDETKRWLDMYALRWAHSDTTVDPLTEEIIHRTPENESLWTGNIIRVDLPENRGTGAGFNAGLEIARGEYIFFISGDALPTKGSILGLIKYLDEHDDTDYIGVNPWVSQSEVEDVPFEGFDSIARQGLGNYAYSYAMIRRKIIDAGVRFADQGPFEGPGCGYEEVEFAYSMAQKGFRAYLFNSPAYYHHRRDWERHGLPEGRVTEILDERRRYLRAKWLGVGFNIIHYHEQPPNRSLRQVAVINKKVPGQPGPAGHFLEALRTICLASLDNPGDPLDPALAYTDYFIVDDGDYDPFVCPENQHPSSFWAIDMVPPNQQQPYSPSLDLYLEKLRAVDHPYCAQLSAITCAQEYGMNPSWLPLAANPQYHLYLPEVDRTWDWVALWHNTGDRIAYAQAASERFPEGFVGYAEGLSYAEYMNRGFCALNLSRTKGLTLRVFEVGCMGVPLVTDRIPDLKELGLVEDTHYLGFDTLEEMLERIQWVKDHRTEAQEMAQQMRKLILSKHTYYHRALQVFGGTV